MHLRVNRRGVALGVLATSLAPLARAQETSARILFIGNSQTYVNNVPALVQACFAGAGLSCDTGMVAKPNYSLEDHWRERDARNELARGGWTHVVLQQGPSSRADSRSNLREYVGRFAERITAVGARPALYSVWPMRQHSRDFANAAQSYALAAADVGGVLCPAAEAWRIALGVEGAPELYDPDGLHATVYGSYLAALVIFAALSGRTPIGQPSVLTFADGQRARVPEDVAAILQAAAAQALAPQP